MCSSKNEKTPTGFNDLCDKVVDIILNNLELTDLANISDTNTRLRNIAGSVFSRKYANHLISFGVIYYSIKSCELELEWYARRNFISCKDKPIIRIGDSKIWFKVLRNFGKFIKFINVVSQIAHSSTRIPNALENLAKYITEYCSDSMEFLELRDYPYFISNKTFSKLHEFRERNCLSEACMTEALKLMPNLRSLAVIYAPVALEKSFPKLERVKLLLRSVKDVHSFISFLQFNQQITYLKLDSEVHNETTVNYFDLIYSSIEQNLTHLKLFKCSITNSKRDSIEQNRIYQFKTVESLNLSPCYVYPFEFDNLQKLTSLADLTPAWLNFIVKLKHLKIYKIPHCAKWWLKTNKAAFGQLIELADLEQIIIANSPMNIQLILKSILGDNWKQIEMKESKTQCVFKGSPKYFSAKYQRIFL